MPTLAPPLPEAAVARRKRSARQSPGQRSRRRTADRPADLDRRPRRARRRCAKRCATTATTQFDLLLDVCGVDFPDRDARRRFEAVYHLYSMPRGERAAPQGAGCPRPTRCCPSLIPVWKGADWFEREAFDMFGFQFDGHPNLRRILCHEGFQGHPLRKDYDPARRWILTEDKIYQPKLDAAAGKATTTCSSA